MSTINTDDLQQVLNHSPRSAYVSTSNAAVSDGCGFVISDGTMRMLLNKLNSIDAKLDKLLRRMHAPLTKNKDTVEVATLPEGIHIPADSIPGLKELSDKIHTNADLRNSLVGNNVVVFIVIFCLLISAATV